MIISLSPTFVGFTEVNHLTVHPTLLLMTTTSLKPRPIRKKRTTTKYKTMTEQKPLVNDTINRETSHSLETITKVQSHLPDIQLISRDALLNDFKNRVKINNYEVKTAVKEFKQLVNQAKELYNSKVKR